MRGDWAKSLSVSIAPILFGLITGIVSARLLQSLGRGQLAEIVMIAGLSSSIGGLSIHQALTERLSNSSSASVMGALVTTSLFVSATSFLLVTAMDSGFEHSVVKEWAGVVIFLSILISANMILTAKAVAERQFLRAGLFRSLPIFVYSLGCIYSLMNTDVISLSYYVGWVTAGYLISVFWLLLLHFFSMSSAQARFRFTRGMIADGSRFHAGNVSLVVFQNLDRLIVLWFLGQSGLGLYAVAFTVANNAAAVVAKATALIAVPSVAAQSGEEAQLGAAAKLISTTAALALLAGFAAAAACPILIPFLFGAAYDSVVVPAMVLCLSSVPSALLVAGVPVLKLLGYWRVASYVLVVGMVVILMMSLAVAAFASLFNIVLVIVLGKWITAGLLVFSLSQKSGQPLTDFLMPEFSWFESSGSSRWRRRK